MSVTTTITGPVTVWQFPDDQKLGRMAFLSRLHTRAELWLRAYALTMPEVSTALIDAHNAGLVRHVAVDHSQVMMDHTQAALVKGLVAAGVEVTVSTSYAGGDYIAHEKTCCDARGNVFTGSTNWSESAWRQINCSLQFNSPGFVTQFRASFERQVAYAWTHERPFQLMAAPPPWLDPPHSTPTLRAA